jgi:ribose/xylose/arabinose/galactoside ABC-type transport system permease subunit
MNRQAQPARVDAAAPAESVFDRENAVRLLVVVALVAAFAVATGGLTVSSANIPNILVQSAIRGIAACGQALVVITAELDLSVSGVVALAMMAGGSLITGNPRYSLLGFALSPWLVVPIMLAVGTAFGLINGLIVSRLRLPALIVTLGSWQIGLGLAYQMTGSGYVDQIPESVAFIGQGSLLSVPNPVIILCVVVAATYFIVHHSPMGAEITAVGGNPRCAYIAGVKVANVKLLVFGIAGLFYGTGAVLAMSRYMTSTMTQASGLELATIAAVAIGGVSLSGGKGTIFGVLLGTLIIGILDNGLSVMGVGPALTSIAKGLIIIVAIALDGWRRRRWV